jgi:hypothetical protein
MLVGIAVIAVCVVVLFALGSGGESGDTGGGGGSGDLAVGACLSAEGDTVVSCDGDDAAYRVLEARDGVARDDAPAACASVPEVVASVWSGDSGQAGTAYCLGNV